MEGNKTNNGYSTPMLTITTFACEDIVRTSDNYGGIPTNWKGFSPEVFGE